MENFVKVFSEIVDKYGIEEADVNKVLEAVDGINSVGGEEMQGEGEEA